MCASSHVPPHAARPGSTHAVAPQSSVGSCKRSSPFALSFFVTLKGPSETTVEHA